MYREKSFFVNSLINFVGKHWVLYRDRAPCTASVDLLGNGDL